MTRESGAHTLQQPSLLDETWPCPVCNATGRDPQKGSTCPMCQGEQVLDFDPEDKSVIPF